MNTSETVPIETTPSGDYVYPPLESGHRAVHQEVDAERHSTFTTTHRYPDGTYYDIENESLAQASNRLHREKNKRDPVEHGLYRLNSAGAPIRPTPSSEEFVEATGLEDKWSTRATRQPLVEPENRRGDDIYRRGALGANAFISTGKNPNKTSNEKADIDARADAIVASYEARDRALADGKSLEEAQAIGEEVWRVHFGMGEAPENNAQVVADRFVPLRNTTNPAPAPAAPSEADPGSIDAEPNNSPGNRYAWSSFPEANPQDPATTAEADRAPSAPEREHSRSESVRKFLKKTGHSALLGARFVHEAGLKDLAHFSWHKSGDAIDSALETIKDKSAELKHRYNAAKEALLDSVDEVVQHLKDRKELYKRKKTIRKRARHVASLRNDDEVARRVQKIRDYIDTKHPPNEANDE